MWLEPDDFPEYEIIQENLHRILLCILILWLIFLLALYLLWKWYISPWIHPI